MTSAGQAVGDLDLRDRGRITREQSSVTSRTSCSTRRILTPLGKNRLHKVAYVMPPEVLRQPAAVVQKKQLGLAASARAISSRRF